MTPDWLAALCALPQQAMPAAAVLVCISATRGSSPRAAGAAMLVGPDFAFDAIGGGQLEWQAMAQARQMLQAESGAAALQLEKLSLGPSLGQCCGGAVQIVWRRLDQAALQALRQAAQSSAQAEFALFWQNPPHSAVRIGAGQEVLHQEPGFCPAPAPADAPLLQADGANWLRLRLGAPRAHLLLYGAGHVGAALAQALLPLPCRLSWCDSRPHAFEHLPPALQQAPHTVFMPECEPADLAQWLQALTPAQRPDAVLIMSHNHQLDLELCALALASDLAADSLLGVIGSASKATRFERQLQARGFSAQQTARLRCPIGLPGITAKHPAIIAASVCAALLLHWQTLALLD